MRSWTSRGTHVFGQLEMASRPQTLNGLAESRIYAENKFSFCGVKGNPIPVAVSAFPDEMYVAPKSWAERASCQVECAHTRIRECSVAGDNPRAGH